MSRPAPDFISKNWPRRNHLQAAWLAQMTKHDAGVAWGSVHWQYLEDMSKVTPHTATPLRLAKEIYIREDEKAGQVLKPLDRDLKPGDELVVRLVLRTDRDMEFVHLKDQRGSGTEPVNVLSHYKYQDGLAYYESTRDASSHFFIDYLPKGTYVFEYPVKVSPTAAATRPVSRTSKACTHRNSTATAPATGLR